MPLLLLIFWGIYLTQWGLEARTQSEILSVRFEGEFKLLKAALEGDLFRLQEALRKVSNIDYVLTKDIGENFLKLGIAGQDFPVAPALHLAITGGTHSHLRVAHRLILSGADLNYFYFNQSDFSFPPPIYFGLGAFNHPTSTQAGILYAIFQSYSDKFNYSTVRDWVRQSGYPPPLHTSVCFDNLDGIFVLSSIPSYDMNERDSYSLTALHVAAWLGNYVHVLFLLQKGANALARDNYNRTFLHYCAIRGISSIPALLLKSQSPLPASVLHSLILAKDNDNNTIIDLSNSIPSQVMFREVIHKYFSLNDYDSTANDWSSISSFDAMDFSFEMFHRVGRSKQRPIRITNNLTSSLAIWSYIWNQSVFLEKFGNLPVQVSNIDQNTSTHDTVRNLLERTRGYSDSDQRICNSGSIIASMQLTIPSHEDFTSNFTKELFGECQPLSPTMVRIYLGDMTGLTLRSHSAAWNVLLMGGPRQWYFLSPGTVLDVVLHEFQHITNFDKDNPLHPELSLDEWQKKVLPILKKHKLVSTVDQRIGDVLYIPHSWSYVVIGSSDSIDVSTIICESSSTSVFHQIPIGKRLYG